MKKVLKITGIVAGSLVMLLILIPLLFQERIEQEVKKLAGKKLKSELNYSDARLSIFRHFPTLTLTLTDFSLKGSAPFEKDTLIRAESLGCGIDLASLFKETIRIKRIWLDHALVQILYNQAGLPNYDIYASGDTVTTVDSTGSASEISFDHISFTNSQLIYDDASIPVRVVASGIDYSGKSLFSDDFFNLTSDINIGSFDLFYDHQPYITGKPVTARMNTRINSRDLTIFFEKNDLKIKDIPLQFNGKFNFEKDGYTLNMTFLSVMEREFVSARLKIRQGERMWMGARATASVDLEKWANAFGLRAAVIRGAYDLSLTGEGYFETTPVKKGPRNEPDTIITSIPSFDLKTTLKNGYLKFSDLPQAVSDIRFSLDASCPDHDYRHIRVALDSLNATVLKNQLKGYFRILNLRDIPIDANLTARMDLSELRQAIPMDSLEIEGILSLDAHVQGNYLPDAKKFPVTNINLKLDKGKIRTVYYPNPVEDIDISAEILNTTGDYRDLKVLVSPATFRFEGKPFHLTASLKNFDNLAYDLHARGVIDLGRIYRVFSLKRMGLNGYIEADLSLKGTQQDAMTGRYQALHNKGTLTLKDIAFSSVDYPRPFIIRTGIFRFDQEKVWFEQFLANYGASDFRLKGYMLNTIGYILSQGVNLKGKFDLASDFVQADEFMYFAGSESSTPSSGGSAGTVIIPRDLDIDFNGKVRRIAFQGLDIRDLHGEIDIKDGILALSGAGFTLAGCTVGMDATYGSIDENKAFFDFSVKAVDFDIKRAYNEVALIRELASSAEKAEGIVSLDYKLKGRLDAEMSPILPSLEGEGTLSLKKVKVSGLKLFNDISKSTQREKIANPDLSKVDIHTTIKNNVITLDQFKFRVSGLRLKIAGTSTLDNQLNLRIRIGLPPLGIFGIPLKVTGSMENLKIRYGRGKEAEEIPDSEYSDELPPELLERLKKVRDEDNGDEPE